MLQQSEKTSNYTLNQFLNVPFNTIDNFQTLYDDSNEILPQSFNDNNIVYVQDEKDLIFFEGQKIIGIDIEQTRVLGYDGQICLIQLKFGELVYILDIVMLSPQNEKLRQILGKLFQDESIIKVFYGGQQDLLWLQRDFNIHVKGYCDIKELADANNLIVDKSLVNLWQTLCQHQFDRIKKKQFQESDWHIRPLSPEQIQYAALDAFYLPYLRYKLISDLLNQKGSLIFLQTVHNKTLKQQLKIYRRERKSSLHFMNYLEKKSTLKNKLTYNHLTLMKYQFSQLCLLKQEISLVHNLPIQYLESDENLLKIELTDIPNLESLAQFSEEISNQNHDPLIWLKEQQEHLKWDIIKQNFLEDLHLKLRSKPEFTLSCINYVFRIEAFKDQQKENDVQRKEIKLKRFLIFQEKFTCHKPVYGGARILALDGTVLCMCDNKKAQWYLKNQLADTIGEDSGTVTIQLRFQPNGLEDMTDKDQLENKLYTATRINQCVVCGAKNNYMKYHIVPIIYKRFFENHFKSHRSHDIILLCLRCHEKASASTDKLKDQIAKQYNQPVVQLNQNQQLMDNIRLLKKFTLTFKNKQFQNKEEKRESKMVLRAIFQEVINDDRIKNSELIQLDSITQTKSNMIKINESFLELCLLIKFHQEKFRDPSNNKTKFNIHGMQVVEQLTEEKDIEEFIMKWRAHFLNIMNPQFLPIGWSVDHKFRRQFGVKSVFYQESQQ